MRKIIGLFLFVVCPFMPWRPPAAKAQQQIFTGTLKLYDSTGHVVCNQAHQFTADLSDINWLNLGQTYEGDISQWNYTPQAPPVIPVMPTAIPPYVAPTTASALVFYDDFTKEPNPISVHDGPITAPGGGFTANMVKWGNNKPWGNNFGYGSNNCNAGGVKSGSSYTTSYTTNSGGLTMNTWNDWNGDERWWIAQLASAAANPGSGATGISGAQFKPPFLLHIACMAPSVAAGFNLANSKGLWPSVSVYAQPTNNVGVNVELDLFEQYSVDFTISHASWHNYQANTAGGATSTITVGAWHTYDLLVNADVTYWYIDGVQVFSATTQAPSALYHFLITNGIGGGWPASLNPSYPYLMKVANVCVFQ